jgi:hypothetical protein
MKTNPSPMNRRAWILTGVLPAVGLLGIPLGVQKYLRTKTAAAQAATRREAEQAAELRRQEAERLRLIKEELAAEERRRTEEKKKRLLNAVREKAETHLKEAGAQDTGSRENIRRELQDSIHAIHARAEQEARRAAEKLGEFWEVAKISILLAKDQLKNTREASKYLTEALQPVTNAMMDLQLTRDRALREMRHHIEEHNNALSSAMLTEVQRIQVEEKVDLESITPGLSEAIAGVQSSQLELTASVLLAPLELGGVVALTSLLRHLLAPVVRRAVTTAGVNAVLVAADGPLPIGDLIALAMDAGFMAWAFYDIRKISQELPGRIEEQICKGLQTNRDTALGNFDKHTVNWLDLARSERTRALEPLLNPS